MLSRFQLFVTLWTVDCQAQEMIYMIFLLERWVLNHNMNIVKIVHSSSNLFMYIFSEQTLRSSDKHWNSKLPYLQNPLLCQRAWWNSWEWLFCFHWKSLQCRALQNTCLSVWNTRRCKYWRGKCLQMKLHLHPWVIEMIIVFSVVIYKPNEILCYCFICSSLMAWNMNKSLVSQNLVVANSVRGDQLATV